ncbi:unnamed protein product [Cochlearia groenlandica]
MVSDKQIESFRGKHRRSPSPSVEPSKRHKHRHHKHHRSHRHRHDKNHGDDGKTPPSIGSPDGFGNEWEKKMEVEAERRRRRERGSIDRERRGERVRDNQCDRENDRRRSRDRARCNSRERGSRENERERRGEKDNDKGRITHSDREKEKVLDDGYGEELRHKHFGHLRHDVEDDLQRRSSNLSKGNNLMGGNSEETWGNVERAKKDNDEEDEVVVWGLAEQEDEEQKRIEESRKRTQAILEKYKKKSEQQNGFSSHDKEKDPEQSCIPKQSSTGAEVLESCTLATVASTVNQANSEFDNDAAKLSSTVGESPTRLVKSDSDRTLASAGLGEGNPESERSDDMFSDDIFGESPAGMQKMGYMRGKNNGLPIKRSGLHDNWDDAEGYYSYQFGELLDDRYEIMATHGKGVFSTVVRAKDTKAELAEPEEVAIKIIRSNETMNKAGQTEAQILKKLAGADPEDKHHCVRFLSSFKYRNHLCLVFESLHMNLREVLKKFGRNIGLQLSAIRVYAKQLFIALKHLKNCGVLHCDIKPDNMLVNGDNNVLKLCDFGSAMFAGKNEVTPYLVSRFYRAPEIILGLSYDHPLDIWSVGCCLYELYSGKVLFPGSTNNEMLRLHMELKGIFPKKMLRKGAFIDEHFDQDLNFYATEEDIVTGKTIKRMMVNIKPTDFGSVIKGYAGEDPKVLAQFRDLLDKLFRLDPEKRLTVSHALAHPFITGK